MNTSRNIPASNFVKSTLLQRLSLTLLMAPTVLFAAPRPTVVRIASFSPLFNDFLRAQYQNDLGITQSKGLIRGKPGLDDPIDARVATAAIEELGLQTYWNPWLADGAY
jgi:hypothetical protein